MLFSLVWGDSAVKSSGELAPLWKN